MDRGYQYDANGNITVIEQNATEPAALGFGYDALDRLDRTEKGTDVSLFAAVSRETYTYDPVGNRLQTMGGEYDASTSVIHTHDDYGYLLGSNILGDIQYLLSITPQSTTYTVDERGNTTGIQSPGDSITLSYNAANRPERAIVNGVATDYQYNALGQRVSKTQNGQSTHYLYNLQGQLIGEYRDDGQPLVEYLYLNGQPLAQLRNGQAYYYHNDHLGTPQKITNQNQEVVWQADYTAFGEATLTTDVVENNLRFAGQYFDGETKLHYNYFRYYDPETGRYLQSDPIGLDGGINTYAYVTNNPLMYIDPYGLEGQAVVRGNFSAALGVGVNANVTVSSDGVTVSASAIVGIGLSATAVAGAQDSHNPTGEGYGFSLSGGMGGAGSVWGKGNANGKGGTAGGGVGIGIGGSGVYKPMSWGIGSHTYSWDDMFDALPDLGSPTSLDDETMIQFCRDNPSARNCQPECY